MSKQMTIATLGELILRLKPPGKLRLLPATKHRPAAQLHLLLRRPL